MDRRSAALPPEYTGGIRAAEREYETRDKLYDKKTTNFNTVIEARKNFKKKDEDKGK